MHNNTILLGHGSGGTLSHELLESIFFKYFKNSVLEKQTDSAVLHVSPSHLSFTTDSYVVNPIFFNGGNIGKLAVSGTVNDLAVSGAKPLYISVSFIIEEGLPVQELETVVQSMAEEAEKAGVLIVTGDTKVVERGKCDKLYINTTGIGQLEERFTNISYGTRVSKGDRIIINGYIGDHGIAIMNERESLHFSSDIASDAEPLNHLISDIIEHYPIHFMRDATRGGVATVLVELASSLGFGIELDEQVLPVRESVKGLCEILGFDPLYVANEGKVIMVVPEAEAQHILNRMRTHEYGKDAAVIGEITSDHPGKVLLHTEIGGKRIVDMLAGEQLPRIC